MVTASEIFKKLVDRDQDIQLTIDTKIKEKFGSEPVLPTEDSISIFLKWYKDLFDDSDKSLLSTALVVLDSVLYSPPSDTLPGVSKSSAVNKIFVRGDIPALEYGIEFRVLVDIMNGISLNLNLDSRIIWVLAEGNFIRSGLTKIKDNYPTGSFIYIGYKSDRFPEVAKIVEKVFGLMKSTIASTQRMLEISRYRSELEKKAVAAIALSEDVRERYDVSWILNNLDSKLAEMSSKKEEIDQLHSHIEHRLQDLKTFQHRLEMMFMGDKYAVPESPRKEIEKIVNQDVEYLSGVGYRKIQILKEFGLRKIGDILIVPRQKLASMRGIGVETLLRIEKSLNELYTPQPMTIGMAGSVNEVIAMYSDKIDENFIRDRTEMLISDLRRLL